MAQNLVPNGSFEDITACPDGPSHSSPNQLSKAAHWDYPTLGSSDFFRDCPVSISGGVGVPSNFHGYQNAFHGISYAGFNAFDLNLSYSEYIKVRLIQNVEPNDVLVFKCYVSLSNKSTHAVYSLGATLKTVNSLSSSPIELDPEFELSNGELLNDTSNWIMLVDTIISEGCSEYLTIGYFGQSDQDTVLVDSNATSFYSNYYIDSVSLNKIGTNNENESIPNVFTPNGDGLNDKFELDDHGEIRVYNRWGQKIYENKEAAIWEGNNLAGDDVPEGNYYYIWKKFQGSCNSAENVKGFVQVFR